LTLAGLGVAPLFDYDEAAHAQTAVEMMRDGKWLLPTMNGQPFYEKPAFLFYFMSAAFALFGENAFAARLPSALFTLATALFLLHVGRRIGRPKLGMTAALIYVSMLMPALLAHAAILDAALNFWVTAAVLGFFLWRHGGKRRDAILATFASGIAVSVKGPVGVVVPLLVIGLDRLIAKDLAACLRRFPWHWGIPAFLLGALPWYVLVTITHGFAFLTTFILRENVDRFIHAMEGHSDGWYYYLIVLIPSTLPWLAWLPWWVKQTLSRWREKEESDELSRLGLVWMLSVIFLFSMARTKLPHYISSMYPVIALGIAAQWHWHSPAHAWNRAASLILLIICLPPALALILLPDFYSHLAPIVKHPRAAAIFSQALHPGLWIPVAGALVALALLLLVRQARRADRSRLLTLYILFGFLLQTSLIWTVAPFAGRLLQKPLMTIAAQIRAAPLTEPVYSLINRPSVSFYSGRSYLDASRPRIFEQLTASSTQYLLVAYTKQLRELPRLPLEVVVSEGDYVLLRYAPRTNNRGAFMH
jgi:4-amino-4-deoxy-L-arabinose transferase-like glycosyltransferase